MPPDLEKPTRSPEHADDRDAHESSPELAGDVASTSRDIEDAADVIARETDIIEQAARTHAFSSTRSAVRRVAQNVSYIERLASSLLDCVDSVGHPSLHLELVRLGPLVADVADRAVCSRDRHRMSCQTASRAVAWVDVLAIERVIASFVRSALLRVPQDLPIWVRLDGSCAMASVSVIDRAGGMPADACEALFAPASTRHHDRAHGLYDCRRAVEAHGGRVGVENVCGKGTRLYFEIPTFDDEALKPRLTARVARRMVADELQVLVVDDRCSRAWPLVDSLRTRGATVALAYEEAGLQRGFEVSAPEVIVVDAEAAPGLRRLAVQAAASGPIAFVAVSSLPPDSPEVRELVSCGAAYVPRPIDLDRLLAVVARLLSL